jgi:hypothetical protein
MGKGGWRSFGGRVCFRLLGGRQALARVGQVADSPHEPPGEQAPGRALVA